jgi:hypothetical protein
MASAEEKILSLKVSRSQLEAKVSGWERSFVALHKRSPTASDKQRSREHRELCKLLSDIDEHVHALERGSLGPTPLQQQPDAEVRAERGRLKARMRRWERDFERTHNRKPTPADMEASTELLQLKQQLAKLAATSAVEDGSGGSGIIPTAPSRAASSGVESVDSMAPPQAGWSHGNDYHELLRSRVESQATVNGFEGISAAELHAAAESFAAWDLDHDGVLSQQEFVSVLHSLAAEGTSGTLDDGTAQRLYALVARAGNAFVDFNEFLAVWKQLPGLPSRGN